MNITELTKWVVDRGDDLCSISTQVQFKKKLDKYFESISCSKCCKTLKVKEKLSFNDWKFSKGLRYIADHTYKDNDGDLYNSDEIEKMYKQYLTI